MVETIGNAVYPVDSVELALWLDLVHEPWNPINAAERQLDALMGDTENPSAMAYDHLYEMANQAVRWLELNSCPDSEIGRRFKARMMGYRIAAGTVRSTFDSTEGDAMVAIRELLTGNDAMAS